MIRRKFLQSASLGTAALASLGFKDLRLAPPRDAKAKYMGGFSAAAKEHLRAAFIGLGYRGNDHLRNFASLPGTTVVGLCDLYQDHVERKLSTLQNLRPELNKEEVKTYWGDEEMEKHVR